MEPNLLERILNISRQMAENKELEPLLTYAMDECLELVGAERGYLVLIGENQTLDFRVQRGKAHQALRGSQDQISLSILTETIRQGEPLIVEDATTHPQFREADSVVLMRLRSVMCVPLIARGTIIGALYVENRSMKGQFSHKDLPPLVLFANQAAVLIENAIIWDQLELRVRQRTAELEQAMVQAERGWQEAVEANKLRTALLGNVAHDLRAPLSMAITALHILLNKMMGDLNAEQDEWITKAVQAVDHALHLTGDVFDLTKIEMGGLKLYRQAVNLNDFLQTIYTIAMSLPWSDGVQFEAQIAASLPILEIDPVRIRQVLLNLLSNALKFTTQGRVILHADVVLQDKAVYIGVADTGEGIPPDQVERLFQRFVQVDTKSDRQQLGTGLGLAICRELVEMHQGQIWVESSPGSGSDFLFTLPIP